MAIRRSTRQVAEELDAATARARVLLDPLSLADVNRRPAPERWSVGECLQHLIETNRAYLPPLRAALQNAPSMPADRNREHSLGWFGSWFAQSMEPPVKTKFKAPRAFVPTKREVGADVFDEFVATQRELLELLERAAATNASKVKLTSPASRFVRLSLIAAFATTASHERRHLYQAEGVSREMRSG